VRRRRREARIALPVHLLADVAGYTSDALSRRYRRNLRVCGQRATIVELTGPALLREQGFEVERSAVRRTGYGHADSHELYLADLNHFFMSSSQLVLAGMVDGRLGGYLTGTLVRVSAKAWINRIAAAVVRERRPYAYYRLTDVAPAAG
jgi:hypothetical protein